MEDQKRTAPVSLLSRFNHSTGWIVSPVFDLLFLANLGWLLLLIPGFSTRSDTVLDFWQIYFLTLPHRWITLLVVILDPDRRSHQSAKLFVVAMLSVLIVLVAYLGTGAFLCLALIDYLWNAWHFASQHAGVLRMYTRKVGGGFPWLERWGLRGFITYAAVRAAGWATGEVEADPELFAVLRSVDLAVLVVPITLITTNLVWAGGARIGKLVYLLSVCALYTGFTISLRQGSAQWIVLFAAAGSMFHAVEYLAVVTHYARRRTNVGSPGRFRTLAGYWGLFLGIYIVAIGLIGSQLAHPDSGAVVFWQGLNLWAAIVHYAFDGMIWKLRRPETAQALGLASASTS